MADVVNCGKVVPFSVGKYVDDVNELANTLSSFSGNVLSEQTITDIVFSVLSSMKINRTPDTESRARLVLSPYFGKTLTGNLVYRISVALVGNRKFIKTGLQVSADLYPFRIVKVFMKKDGGNRLLGVRVLWLVGPASGVIDTYYAPHDICVRLLSTPLGVVWRRDLKYSIRSASAFVGMIGNGDRRLERGIDFFRSVTASPGMRIWNQRIALAKKAEVWKRIMEHTERERG